MYWPAITINHVTFRGDLNVDNILEDICASLSHKPSVCTDFYEEEHIAYDEEIPVANGVSVEVLVALVTVLVLVNIALIVAYKQCVKKEMEQDMGFKVSAAVSQYISLQQQNRNNSTANTSIEM